MRNKTNGAAFSCRRASLKRTNIQSPVSQPQGTNHERLIVFSVIITLVCPLLSAAPYNGDVFTFTQPDGTEIEAKLYGDEFYCRVESLDGYTLTKEPDTGWITYAVLNEDRSDLISTQVIYDHRIPTDPQEIENLMQRQFRSRRGAPAHASLKKGQRLNRQAIREIAARNRALLDRPTVSPDAGEGLPGESTQSDTSAAPVTGEILGLTLLIQFPDETSTIAKSAIENYCNQVGYNGNGNNGSVRDYFYDVSNGLLTYTNHVTQYYTAQHEKSYYTDPLIDYGQRARELILEALTWLDNQGFDFRTLSRTGDNRLVAINAFYAGDRENYWAEGLWPHMSYYGGFTSNEGVKSGVYQITNIGSSLKLGTFCHENGHMLCQWPDLYDYGYESNGVGNFCLMCSGGSDYNPVPPCAYLRYTAGWESLVNITSDTPRTLREHVANGFETFKYSNPGNSKEYFLIESRLKTGRNASLPDEGLLIWHIDENGDNDNEQMTKTYHYLVSLEQADGDFDLEFGHNWGDSGDLFNGGYRDAFDDQTLPDALWWDGSDSGLKIAEISPVGPVMSFLSNYCVYEPIFADFDLSGWHDLPDLCVISDHWLGGDAEQDIFPREADGVINLVDFSAFAAIWLTPSGAFGENFESGDFSRQDWQRSGDAWWDVVSDSVYEGQYAAKSGDIGNSQQSSLEITIDTTRTHISFYAKVSSERTYDYLRFYIDGIPVSGPISGQKNWTQHVYDVGESGVHTFRWTYSKDSMDSAGDDCAWIDKISLY